MSQISRRGVRVRGERSAREATRRRLSVGDVLRSIGPGVITGGADTTNDPFTFMCFSKTPALSLTSQCRPFSESADGTMLGEGISMFALKRLADAERDGEDEHRDGDRRRRLENVAHGARGGHCRH